MTKQFNVALNISLTGNFNNQATRAIGQANTLNTRLKTVQMTAKKMQGQFMSGLKLAAPLAAVGFFAAKWEEGLAKLSTVTGMTMDDIKKRLGPGLKRIAQETGQSLGQVVEAAYQGSSAGIANKDLLKASSIASKLAVGGFTDIKTAMDSLTNIQNVWGTSMDKAADILINTQNLGKTTVGEIGRSIGQVSSIAKNAGVSMKDFGATVSALTKAGLPTAEAMTAIKASIAGVTNKSPQMMATLKKIGSNFSLSTLHTENYGIAIREVVNKVKAHTKDEGTRAKMLKNIFGQIRGLNAIYNITSKEGMKTYDEAMKRNNSNTKSAEKAFETMSKTTAMQFKRMKVQLQIFAVQIGSVLLPAINSLFKTIGPVFKKMGDWAKQNKGTVKVLGMVLAGVVALKLAIGVIGFAIMPVITVFKALTVAVGLAKFAVIGFKGILLGGFIGLAIGGLILIVKHWDKITAAIGRAIEAVKKYSGYNFAKKMKNKLTGEIQSRIDTAMAGRGVVDNSIAEAVASAGDVGSGIKRKNPSVQQKIENKPQINITIQGGNNPTATARKTAAMIERSQIQTAKGVGNSLARTGGKNK